MITRPKPWLIVPKDAQGPLSYSAWRLFCAVTVGRFSPENTALFPEQIFCMFLFFVWSPYLQKSLRMLLQHSNSDFWLIINYSHPLVVPHGFQDKTLVPVRDVWGFWWPCPACGSLISYGPALPASSHAQYPGMCVCPALSWLLYLFLLSEWKALPPCLFQVNLACFFHLQESFNPLFKCLS